MLPQQQERADKGKNGFHMSQLTKEEVDLGFAFIEEQAADLGSEWKRVQCMTKNLHIDHSSPIFQWPQGLVEKSLKAIQTDGVLSLPIEDFHFSLADVNPSILDFAFNHMIGSMKTHADGLVGGLAVAKRP